jgi:hypothetical protein
MKTPCLALTLAAVFAIAFTASAMEVHRFKCKIKWPWSENPSRGNIMCLVSTTAGGPDLAMLDGVELDDFWRFNGKVDGDLEDFKKLNGAKTKVIYKRKSTDSPFRRKAWLKVKDGRLYCFYKTRYGKKYAESFGVANTDTGGWMTKAVKIKVESTYPGFKGWDEATFTMEYMTKAGKKSIMRLPRAKTGGPPPCGVGTAAGPGFGTD